MSALNPVGALPTQPVTIEEDSTIMKAFSCNPWFGMYMAFMQERLLMTKISAYRHVPLPINLIDVKNQYTITGIVSAVTSIALLIVGIAFKFFDYDIKSFVCFGPLGLLLGHYVTYFAVVAIGLGVLGIAGSVHKILHNNQVIKELKENPQAEVEVW